MQYFHNVNKDRKLVLIVDDDTDLCVTTEVLVKSFGYGAVTANDGEEAIEKYKTNKPDLVLLDVKLPKKDGYETFFDIKSFDEGAKIILMSAFQDYSKWQDAKSKCAIYFVTKPYSAAFLKELVDRHVDDPFVCTSS